ncbi:hydrolase, alpha/beta fold family protein [Cryptosporidium muris RN66]|uniref:Hydrolase, alpha/beta fold family protein n=1 Tax=Cryptosporidium muris (strain RN66) TaxID=441375 RepID=B6AAP6_CRYMR|nr:hydrolase, alpha/beta fold family protein [Cryptosporidium muris RN66]EEA05448.1 hydrolase, alpha/beta fold family protein [Cryptosporidium muris RN66]|eukprot:XP_002139797.1 hydrolase, alpha/beta fold family protein [Cryptosporidium muris RN66]
MSRKFLHLALAYIFAYLGTVTVFCDDIPADFYYEKRSEITLSQGTVNYQLHENSTDGIVTVCLHCYIGTLSDCSYISKYLSSEGFRALRFDFYGHGLSNYKGFGYYTEYDYVEQIVEILQRLGLADIKNNPNDKINLIGTSLGALIAMNFAIMYPENVKTLILDAPPGLRTKVFAPYLRYKIVNYPLQLIANIFKPKWAAYQFLNPPTENYISPKLDFRATYYGRQIILTSLQVLLGIDLWYNVELFEKLGQTDIDVLFFWGTEDRLCPLSDAIVTLNKYLADSKILLYENCKHRCMKYCKVKFANDVLSYLKDLDLEFYTINQLMTNFANTGSLRINKSNIRGILESSKQDDCNEPENFVQLLSEDYSTSGDSENKSIKEESVISSNSNNVTELTCKLIDEDNRSNQKNSFGKI